ncbi:MAG: D-alanyl-D-alanine carboxypeptidase family protein [Rhizobiaceae bacterium]
MCSLLTALAVLPARAGTSILVDVNTGEVLAQDEAFKRWYPASLTKLMTAYIAFEAMKSGRLAADSPVKISANAAKQPPSRMGYKPGNVLNLDNAIKIMMVKSANDIAVAVAETVAGPNYQQAMNAAAQSLGMTGTNFVNANGIHSTNNYSTARDLAILASALRSKHPEYASYFGIEAIQYGKTVERNYNILLGRFNGADGMKTGFVCAAGFNLVASATQNGRTLVAVVLGATSQEQRAEKAANLLAAGFQGTAGTLGDLATLQPDGPVDNKAVDMRSSVCTKEAEASRWDGREIEGKITFETPYIAVMTRAPNTIKVGLGGAKGGTASKGKGIPDDLTRIPVPRQKPQRSALMDVPLENATLRPGIANEKASTTTE